MARPKVELYRHLEGLMHASFGLLMRALFLNATPIWQLCSTLQKQSSFTYTATAPMGSVAPGRPAERA